MITPINLPNQQSTFRSLPGCTLSSTQTAPYRNEDWRRSVEHVDAHIAEPARLVMHTDPHSMAADRYRLMRMHLQTLAKTKQVKAVMVTSALPREGKTMTALNVAIALSECSPNSVVLAELDLRRPALARRLGLEKRRGLGESLQDGSDALAELRCVEPLGIYLLPAGEPASKPFELLNSDPLARTIGRLRSMFDWVVLDTPPAVPVPDILAIRGLADGCLWVLHAHTTPRDLVKEAMEQVGADRILGMVLNHAAETEHYAPYYGAQLPLARDGKN